MSKPSLIIGLLLSVLVHGAILLPDTFRLTLEVEPGTPADDPVAVRVTHAPRPEPTPAEQPTVPEPEEPEPQVAEPEVEHTEAPVNEEPIVEEEVVETVEETAPPVEPEPEPEILEPAPVEVDVEQAPAEPAVVVEAPAEDLPETQDSPPPGETVAPDVVRETEALERVVEPAKPVTPATTTAPRTSTSDADEEDDAIPSLRIEWDSQREVFTVAQALGMRVVAIDYSNAILGELRSATDPVLLDFDGRLSGYSNRIRTLHREYFGPSSAWSPDARVAALWILVPAHVDRDMVNAQQDAIRKTGRRPRDVRTTIGRFKRVGGRYRLIISDVK